MEKNKTSKKPAAKKPAAAKKAEQLKRDQELLQKITAAKTSVDDTDDKDGFTEEFSVDMTTTRDACVKMRCPICGAVLDGYDRSWIYHGMMNGQSVPVCSPECRKLCR